MPIAKENVIDLRKPKPSQRPKIQPVKKKRKPETPKHGEFEASSALKTATLASAFVALSALAAYFAKGGNYLSAAVFVLAGVTLALAIYLKRL